MNSKSSKNWVFLKQGTALMLCLFLVSATGWASETGYHQNGQKRHCAGYAENYKLCFVQVGHLFFDAVR